MTTRNVLINRRGIRKLLDAGWAKTELAQRFQISRPFLDRILGEAIEPEHPGVTLFINEAIQNALNGRT